MASRNYGDSHIADKVEGSRYKVKGQLQ